MKLWNYKIPFFFKMAAVTKVTKLKKSQYTVIIYKLGVIYVINHFVNLTQGTGVPLILLGIWFEARRTGKQVCWIVNCLKVTLWVMLVFWLLFYPYQITLDNVLLCCKYRRHSFVSLSSCRIRMMKYLWNYCFS